MDDLTARMTQQFEATHAIQFEITGAGMSRVFVAEERALNRKVVIKVLSPALAAAVNVERFSVFAAQDDVATRVSDAYNQARARRRS